MLKEFQKVMNKNAAKIAAISSKDSEEVIEKKVAAAEEKEPKVKVKPAVDYLDEFINEESRIKEWSMETRKMVKSLKNHLNKFKKNVGLDFYDQNGIDKFINYLRSTAGLEESSAEKVYKNLAWFLRWAIRKKYTQVRDIESYEPVFKTVKKPVIFLTQDELDKVFNLEIPKTGTKLKLHDMNGKEYEKKVIEHEGMSIARDLFCFCAFTSLRYSDVVEVRRTDIHDGVLTITTQKTHDRLPIDLNPYSRAILDKYKDLETVGDHALPVISNQKMNQYLKDLGKLCGFNEPITRVCFRAGARVEETYPKYEMLSTHAGRRTFICLALSSGIPPQVVMKWTGHCDYKSMKPYIDIAGKTKSDAMNTFANSLSL